jgi:hypothetical protein
MNSKRGPSVATWLTLFDVLFCWFVITSSDNVRCVEDANVGSRRRRRKHPDRNHREYGTEICYSDSSHPSHIRYHRICSHMCWTQIGGKWKVQQIPRSWMELNWRKRWSETETEQHGRKREREQLQMLQRLQDGLLGEMWSGCRWGPNFNILGYRV